jgi:hypothetical protein
MKHEFVFSHPGVDEPGALLTLYVSANALGITKTPTRETTRTERSRYFIIQ